MFIVRAGLRSGGSARILSKQLAPSTSASVAPQHAAHHAPSSASSLVIPSLSTLNINIRSLSSTGSGNDGNGGGDDKLSKNDDDDDNFLLQDDDTLPTPPSYVRESVTGKWTSQTHAELSSKDAKLLNLDDESKSEEVMGRLGERWTSAASAAGVNTNEEGKDENEGGIDGFGTLNEEHERVSRRIQEQQLAMGTIGRDPANSIKKQQQTGETTADANDDSSSPANTESGLTPRELQALKTYAQKEYNVPHKEFTQVTSNDPDLIPINTISSGSDGSTDSKQFFDADLDLAYLNPRLNRKAFKAEGEEADYDPFADLLPSDLNPARKVNRRHAKPIPKKLLHHNNLSLLRRYTTPGGKIMNRVQSRLGAKDQRKIAKLVKRARHLGIIPYLGQWKFEDHGNLHESGLTSASSKSNNNSEVEGKRDWELELEQRGLWPLQDDTELVQKYYDLEGMMEHMAGPKGSRTRGELESLLGGVGALVKKDDKDSVGSAGAGEEGEGGTSSVGEQQQQ